MTELIPYDVARTALAEAKAVDDVKHILDKAIAMKVYAKRAADKTMELDAAEIRFHAERRLGQMIIAQKETVGLNRGTRGQLQGPGIIGAARTEAPIETPPKLADVGISHKLSAHAQKMASVPALEFEARLGAWREEVSEAGARVTMDLLKIGEAEQQRQNRHDLAQTLSDTSAELTGERRYPCIYADPAWKRKAGIGDRAYENHYATMDWDDILSLPVAELLLPDAWGFIWIPRAHMLALHPVKYKVMIDDGSVHEVMIKTPLIWAIARAWGFDNYSTCHIWCKTGEDHPDEKGTGLIWRDQNEILCLFKRGNGLPMQPAAEKFGSEHRERSRLLGHSRKPQFYREMIAAMTAGLPVLEMFARVDGDHPLPENWDAWGNESAPEHQVAAE